MLRGTVMTPATEHGMPISTGAALTVTMTPTATSNNSLKGDTAPPGSHCCCNRRCGCSEEPDITTLRAADDSFHITARVTRDTEEKNEGIYLRSEREREENGSHEIGQTDYTA